MSRKVTLNLGLRFETLDDYRCAETDDFEDRLAQLEKITDPAERRRETQEYLRNRLFEISRRNRLVYFKETTGSTNLTVGSLPFTLDYRSIKASQLLVASGEISSAALVAGMHATRPGAYEYQVKAVVDAAQRDRGAISAAYPTIVGSGPNATFVHYAGDRRQMTAGDLLLVDAALDFGSFAFGSAAFDSLGFDSFGFDSAAGFDSPDDFSATADSLLVELPESPPPPPLSLLSRDAEVSGAPPRCAFLP